MKTNLLLAGFLLAAALLAGPAATAAVPTIVTPPASQVVAVGDSAVLTVTAAGRLPMTYIWQNMFSPGVYWRPTLDASNCTLVLSNLTASDACTMFIRVSNADGVSSMKQAVVGVVTPRTETNGFSLNIRALTNTQWRIECNTNLTGTNWFTLTNISFPAFPPIATLKYVDPAGTNAHRFYRVFPKVL